MNKKIKIAIVDDIQLIVDGHKNRFEKYNAQNLEYEIEVVEAVYEAEKGTLKIETIIEKVLSFAHKIDILLLDMEMPKGKHRGGIRVLQALYDRYEKDIPCKTIIYSEVKNDTQVIKKGLKLGAKGYFYSVADGVDLTNAIIRIYEGEEYFFSKDTYKKVVEGFLASPLDESLMNNDGLGGILPEDKEILANKALGLSVAAIGQQMGLTTDQINNRINQMCAISGVINGINTHKLIIWAIKTGILDVNKLEV